MLSIVSCWRDAIKITVVMSLEFQGKNPENPHRLGLAVCRTAPITATHSGDRQGRAKQCGCVRRFSDHKSFIVALMRLQLGQHVTCLVLISVVWLAVVRALLLRGRQKLPLLRGQSVFEVLLFLESKITTDLKHCLETVRHPFGRQSGILSGSRIGHHESYDKMPPFLFSLDCWKQVSQPWFLNKHFFNNQHS